jgi:hypothetical protein
VTTLLDLDLTLTTQTGATAIEANATFAVPGS